MLGIDDTAMALPAALEYSVIREDAAISGSRASKGNHLLDEANRRERLRLAKPLRLNKIEK